MNVLDTMPPEAKKWYAYAIAGMVAADGQVDKTEIEFLKQAIGFLDNAEESAALIVKVKQGEKPDLDRVKVTKDQAFAMLKSLTQLAVIDADLSQTERDYLKELAAKVGFPPEVPEKLLEIASQHLNTGKTKVKLSVEGKEEYVECFELSTEGCRLNMKRVINPRTQINLQMLDNPENEESKLFAPITGKVQWFRHSKNKPEIIFIKIHFLEDVTVNHGFLQYIEPEEYGGKGTTRKPEPINPNVAGIYVECRVCGQKDIPAWTRKSPPKKERNIFGVELYDGDPNHFDLIRVITCPKCLFATTDIKYFHKQGDIPRPSLFDMERFPKKWFGSLHIRKQWAGDDGAWLIAQTRTPAQAAKTYRLSAETHDHIGRYMDQGTTHEHDLQTISDMLVQSSFLIAMDVVVAESLLFEVVRRYETLVKILEGIPFFQGLRTMALIKNYFKDDHGWEGLYRTLQKYAESSKATTDPRTEAYLKGVLEEFKVIDENRNEYGRNKLKNYVPQPVEMTSDAKEKTGSSAGNSNG